MYESPYQQKIQQEYNDINIKYMISHRDDDQINPQHVDNFDYVTKIHDKLYDKKPILNMVHRDTPDKIGRGEPEIIDKKQIPKLEGNGVELEEIVYKKKIPKDEIVKQQPSNNPVSKVKRRGALIKKLMKEHGWTLIKASQEIAKQKLIY